MEYNLEYINLKHTLITYFLIKVDENILDISYSINANRLIIQIVLIEGCIFSSDKIESLKNKLSSVEITFKEIYLTKKQFNESNEWEPKYYQWLDYLLFSKAEA